MKTYYIKTYGCQMNVADSAKLAAVLEAAGYQPISLLEEEKQSPEYQKADIILVNTCVVRQHAEDRAVGFVSSLKNLKIKNPNSKIVLCGCMVTEPGRDLKKEFPFVDLFIPPNSPEKLAEFLNSSIVRRPFSSFVTIMHGCDNFCSYCIVPYVRGREFSRPMEEVLKEIKDLVEQGVTDVTLLGQNVNSYEFGLAKLLREIEAIPRPSSFVLRFMTSHPRDMSDEIIEAVAELPYVAKEFIMPLQSGDNEILRKMNRGYTLEYYIERVNKIRSLMPQARLVADILVGFPGETEEQFQNTLRAIELIKFDEVHMFAYSDRPGTAASFMTPKLPEEVKQKRLQALIKVVRKLVSVL